MDRPFKFSGDEWEAEGTGTSVTVGPDTENLGVSFRCITDPTKGPYDGTIREVNPYHVSRDELITALGEAIKESNE